MKKTYDQVILESANNMLEGAWDDLKHAHKQSKRQMKTIVKMSKAGKELDSYKGAEYTGKRIDRHASKGRSKLASALGTMSGTVSGATPRSAKIATGVAAAGLTGLALWRMKKKKCRKKCENQGNPELKANCLEKC